MQSIAQRVTRVQLALAALAFVAVSAFYAFATAPANAAASPTTGIDYVSDLVTPIKSELTLAIVAGLGLLVVLMAVKAGVKLIRSFGK
jgi:hypothetical protein